GLRLGGKTENTPGALNSVVPEIYDLLVTGDFENVFVLPKEGERYEIAKAAKRSLLARSHSHLAVSGPDGTSLLQLGSESRLSSRGRAGSYLGAGLLLAAGVLTCLALLVEGSLLDFLFALVKGGRQSAKPLSTRFEQPPPELVESCAEGRSTVWAGAGL